MCIKFFFFLVVSLAVFEASTSLAQPANPKTSPVIGPDPTEPTLTRFDLDFPGGTPGELVATIQKATARPLNAIIPTEFATVRLPPLKMKAIDVRRLFDGLWQASHSMVLRVSQNPQGTLQYTQNDVEYGFRTQGPITDDAVWFFFFHGPPPLPKVFRFYLLTPYLERGLTVDDITTAVQTSWKMTNNGNPPSLSFHKETKLLIAVGELGQLETIDAALHALDTSVPSPTSIPQEKK